MTIHAQSGQTLGATVTDVTAEIPSYTAPGVPLIIKGKKSSFASSHGQLGKPKPCFGHDRQSLCRHYGNGQRLFWSWNSISRSQT